MSVSDGQPVNAATTNAAYVSKTDVSGNTVTGIVDLANTTDVNSGASIANTQQAINETFDAVGMTGIGDSARKNYTTNYVVQNGDSRKQAIERLDAEFEGTTGHTHTGVNGDGTKISAASLDNYNNFFAEFQEFTFDAASGTSIDITTEMSGKSPGGDSATAGVITTAPNNRAPIQGKTSYDNIEDGEGDRVYSRITESGGTWTLSFYTIEAGVETAHNLSSQDIRIYFREVFTSATRPTIGSSVANIVSLDFTADVVDASATQRGVVNLLTQTFTGIKNFANRITVDALALFIRTDHTNYFWGDDIPAFMLDTDTFNDSSKAVAYGSSDVNVNKRTNDIIIQSGSNTFVGSTQTTGDIYNTTGFITDGTATGATGSLYHETGENSGTGATGEIRLSSGNSAANNSGDNRLTTGTASGAGKKSGEAKLITGTGSSGANSGNISLEIGTTVGGGTRGKIKFVDGSEGTPGHIWTQSAADGSGQWQAAPAAGANASLSNLTDPTAVNQDLIMTGVKTVRLTNNTALVGRNVGNSANIDVAKVDGSDNVILGSGSNPTTVSATSLVMSSNNFNVDSAGLVTVSNSSGAGTPKKMVDFNNAIDQNPGIDWNAPTNGQGLMFTEDGVQKLRIQGNGRVIAPTGFSTNSGLNFENFRVIRGTTGGAVDFNAGDTGTAAISLTNINTATQIREMLRITTNKSDSGGLTVRGVASQTANLVKVENSSGSSIFSVSADGNTSIVGSGAQMTVSNSVNDPTFDFFGNSTTPSGVANSGGIKSRSTSTAPLSMFTSNDTNANATPTRDVLIETGNKTAGTGGSGNIKFKPGTSAGGLQGYIQFDSLVAVLPTGTSDPSTSYPDGSSYYNTSTDQIRVLRGGTWRGVTLT